MCRHLAYLGPPVSLASLIIDPPHSLYRQSWAPSDMRGGGSVNADGFGLGWYADPGSTRAMPGDNAMPSEQVVSGDIAASGERVVSGDNAASGERVDLPVRYRRSVPIWADESLPGLASSISSDAVLAAVRNGTVGAPLTETAVAPFTKDQWLFSHNGLISGWPGAISKLAESLPVNELLTLDAPMDSALIWALIQDRLHLGAPEAVASVVRDVAAAAPGSRLNLLLTDGEQIVATTWTHSLWTRTTTDSIAVSSEPWTTEGWEQIPDHSLLLATKSTLAVTPLLEGRQCHH